MNKLRLATIAGALTLALCLPALGADGRYSMKFDVANREALLAARSNPVIEIDGGASVLPRGTAVMETVNRLYPSLDPDTPMVEEVFNSSSFGLREDGGFQERIGVRAQDDLWATGYYRIALKVNEGQRPKLKELLGDEISNLRADTLVFVGAKSRAFDIILNETRESLKTAAAFLARYNRWRSEEGRRRAEGGELKLSAVLDRSWFYDGEWQKPVLEKSRLSMPPVAEHFLDVWKMMRAALFPPGMDENSVPSVDIELEATFRQFELLSHRYALLNLHYFIDDAVTRFQPSVDTLLAAPDAATATALEAEWRATAASATALWAGLLETEFSEENLNRLELWRTMGSTPEYARQSLADCDAFYLSLREEDFLETAQAYIDAAAALNESFADLLNPETADGAKGRIRAARTRLEAADTALRKHLRFRAELPKEEEPEK